MIPWWVIAVVLAAVVMWYRFGPKWKASARERQLENQYRRLLRLPEAEADAVIRSQMQKLQLRHPDRSRVWYLEKMIYDLQRDR